MHDGTQYAPRKSFDILALYKSDYYYYIIMTRSKVKVKATSPSMLEIFSLSKAIFSTIHSGSWQLVTDS